MKRENWGGIGEISYILECVASKIPQFRHKEGKLFFEMIGML